MKWNQLNMMPKESYFIYLNDFLLKYPAYLFSLKNHGKLKYLTKQYS